jgi:hypothetical protein
LRISDRDNLNERINKRQNKAENVYTFQILTVVMRRVSMTATQVLQKANALHNSTTTATACEPIIHEIPTVSCGNAVGYNAGLKHIHYSLQHKKIKLGQENC